MNVAIVLHSHLPWVRQHGTWPCGEEWLHQAASESLLPLLDVLERLAGDGRRDLLTLGITPVLAEQMDDAYVLGELHGWLGRRLLDLEVTVSRTRAADVAALRPVWEHHWRRQAALLERVEGGLLGTGLVAPFAALQQAGTLELLGGPATHPYLALFDDPALIAAQVGEGLRQGAEAFGTRPLGMWVPECSYRPEGCVADPTRPPLDVAPDGTPTLARSAAELPGLERAWQDAGVGHVVLDGPTLACAAGAPPRDWTTVAREVAPPGGPLDVLDRPVLIGGSDVAAFGRNLPLTYAVWSPTGGYPGDPWYRDFHSADELGGFKSWRVTDLGRTDKAPYDAGAAAARAEAHAQDFVALLHRHLDPRPDDAVAVVAFDTELLGHWWYEGPRFLESVLRHLVADPTLRPTTLQSYLERHPPTRALRLPESSWGRGKGHASWATERTRPLWQALREAEQRFSGLPPGPARDAAWRQLSLAQASDWPFLVARGESARYAEERLADHLERFERACRAEGLEDLADADDPSRRHGAPPELQGSDAPATERPTTIA